MKKLSTYSAPARGQALQLKGRTASEKRCAALASLAAYTARGQAAALCPFPQLLGGLPVPAQGFAIVEKGHAYTAQGQATRKQRRAGIVAGLAALLKGFAAAVEGQAALAAGQSNTVQGHVATHCPALVMRENHIQQGIQQKNAQRARSPDLVRRP